MAFRIDQGQLRSPRRRKDGTMVVDAYITRSGVFTYANPDGSLRREYRPPDEVERADSLESFQLVPVTNDHPPEMVDAANARKYAVGASGENVVMDGDLVKAPLLIFDRAAVDALETGKAQISCGYRVDIDETPGIAPSGEKYDAIQRNIQGNHIAIVDQGRAGPNVKVRMDASIMVDLTQPSEPHEDKLSMDAKEIQAQLTATQLDQVKETLRADQAESALKDAQTQIEVLSAERDDARDKLEAAEKAAEASNKERQDTVQASVALRLKAISLLPESDKGPARFDGLSDKDIKLQVIEHLSGKRVDEGKSDEYIDARFDAATEDAAPAKRTDTSEDVAPVAERKDEAALQARQAKRLRELNPYYANKQ